MIFFGKKSENSTLGKLGTVMEKKFALRKKTCFRLLKSLFLQYLGGANYACGSRPSYSNYSFEKLLFRELWMLFQTQVRFSNIAENFGS